MIDEEKYRIKSGMFNFELQRVEVLPTTRGFYNDVEIYEYVMHENKIPFVCQSLRTCII